MININQQSIGCSVRFENSSNSAESKGYSNIRERKQIEEVTFSCHSQGGHRSFQTFSVFSNLIYLQIMMRKTMENKASYCHIGAEYISKGASFMVKKDLRIQSAFDVQCIDQRYSNLLLLQRLVIIILGSALPLMGFL